MEITYDVYINDSPLAGHIDLTEAQLLNVWRSLNTSYPTGSNLKVQVMAKDGDLTMLSDAVNLVVPINQTPVVTSSAPTNVSISGFTANGIVSNSDGPNVTQIEIAYGLSTLNSADDTGATKVLRTGKDIANGGNISEVITATLLDGSYKVWIRAYDSNWGAWSLVQTFLVTADRITNGGFETGDVAGWTVSDASWLTVVTGEAGATGTYCGKAYKDNPALMTTFSAYQEIIGNVDDINKFSMRLKPVSTELTYTNPTDTQSQTTIKLQITAYDTTDAILQDTVTNQGCRDVYLHGCNFTKTGTWAQGAWDWQKNTINNAWSTFPKAGDAALKTWITNNLKAGKTWTDVAKIRISVQAVISPSTKVGFRLDDVKAI